MTDEAQTTGDDRDTGPYASWQDALRALRADDPLGNAARIATARALHAGVAAAVTGTPQAVAQVTEGTIEAADGTRVGVRTYRATTDVDAPAMLFAHGGGWVLGSLDTHDNLCRAICSSSGWTVVSVDYRRAPEHVYPTALDDFETVFEWLVANAAQLGVDPERIVVGGDSAGANLAAGLCVRRSGAGIVAQVLIYPALAGLSAPESWAGIGDDALLPLDSYEACYRMYVGGDDDRLRLPEVSPSLAADPGMFPSTLIVVGAGDGLALDSRRFSERLSAAGVEARCVTYDGVEHGFIQVADLPARTEAIGEIASMLRSLR